MKKTKKTTHQVQFRDTYNHHCKRAIQNCLVFSNIYLETFFSRPVKMMMTIIKLRTPVHRYFIVDFLEVLRVDDCHPIWLKMLLLSAGQIITVSIINNTTGGWARL